MHVNNQKYKTDIDTITTLQEKNDENFAFWCTATDFFAGWILEWVFLQSLAYGVYYYYYYY